MSQTSRSVDYLKAHEVEQGMEEKNYPGPGDGLTGRLEELRTINTHIVEYLASENVNLPEVIPQLAICLGRFSLTPTEIAETLSGTASIVWENTSQITAINMEYLLFARQTARDVSNGQIEGLVILGMDLRQAKALGKLTRQQLNELARRWRGRVFEVLPAASQICHPLHSKAISHYSAALLSAC
jgi:hypothetical protein